MANLDESSLSTRANFLDSIKSSWPPIFRATAYAHLKNLTLDPSPSPVNRGATLSQLEPLERKGDISVHDILKTHYQTDKLNQNVAFSSPGAVFPKNFGDPKFLNKGPKGDHFWGKRCLRGDYFSAKR